MVAINLAGPVRFSWLNGTGRVQRTGEAALFTHQTRCIRMEAAHLHYLVVHLHPFGLMHFLKQSLSTLPCDDLLLLDSRSFPINAQTAEALSASAAPGRMVRVVEEQLLRFFTKVSSSRNELGDVLQFLRGQYSCFSREELARFACLSYRQLSRKFEEQVGMSPKQYAQVVRFRNAYDQLMARRGGNMMDIVAEHNFFDQMHMIRLFRQFTDCTPGQLRQPGKAAAVDYHLMYARAERTAGSC
jgi:AraC-like DNA-binding protein